MAKIIAQITFADYSEIEILGDLERFGTIFVSIAGNGRRGSDAEAGSAARKWSQRLPHTSHSVRSRIEHLLLDKGYDFTEMIRTAKGFDIIPIVDIRNCWKDGETTKQYKDTDVVYDYQGNVYYIDDKGEQRRMHYEGYDKEKKCLRYSYNGKMYKIYTSYDERVFLPVARDSVKFKRLYKGRTSVERLNGRTDRDYMFEDHCIHGLKKMKLMLSLTLLTMNAMALGKIQQGQTNHLAALTRLDLPNTA